MILALLFLILAIGCYSISQLIQHDKFKWTIPTQVAFWGQFGDARKYKWPFEPAKKNWYTKLFKIKYKERWPTSTNFTVFLTDSYHLMQFFFFLFISMSIGMALQLNWWLIAVVWLLVHLVHFGVYRLLEK